MLKLGVIGSPRGVKVLNLIVLEPKKFKSVKPNCKGVVEGVGCWFKMWKVLGNYKLKWQLKLKR